MSTRNTANAADNIHIELHVSPQGNDRHEGSNAKPLKTLAAALQKMRQQRARLLKPSKTNPQPRPASLRVVMHDGLYQLDKPVRITHKDSGVPALRKKQLVLQNAVPLTITAAPNARPVLSGGRKIEGFKTIKHQGKTAWVTTLPQVRKGQWTFTQLWVNETRASRPRWPEKGYLFIEEALDGDQPAPKQMQVGQDSFRYKQGDLIDFQNPGDIEFVALHYWIETRRSITAINPQTRQVKLALASRLNLKDETGGCYYLDNVFENLKKPGQWYLHQQTGKLYYLPKPGQTLRNTTLIAPVLRDLLTIEGDHDAGAYASDIRFENITFSHNEFHPSLDDLKATPQAACHVPGAVRAHFARDCHFDRCSFSHLGSYGIEFRDASLECSVTRSHLHDLAAGGVKIFHDIIKPYDNNDPKRDRVEYPRKTWRSCQRIELSDNHIHDGGHRFRQAVAVLAGVCNGVKIIHNHIHDFDYTGISVGWQWGYERSDTFGNVVEWNHIHDIGRGVLSDMGAIYLLGHQCGTRVRYNLIHDVVSRGYGGWGIYPDEGSEDLLIEFNLCARTKHAGISQHYGKNSMVRNNITLFPGPQAAVGCSAHEPHVEFFYQQNIIVTDHPAILNDPYHRMANGQTPVAFERNLYFNTQGQKLTFRGKSFTQWKKSGQDKGSLIADPKFKNAKKLDIRLPANSPAYKIGFTPFDLSKAGVRK